MHRWPSQRSSTCGQSAGWCLARVQLVIISVSLPARQTNSCRRLAISLVFATMVETRISIHRVDHHARLHLSARPPADTTMLTLLTVLDFDHYSN
jgi:hypothetical protein